MSIKNIDYYQIDIEKNEPIQIPISKDSNDLQNFNEILEKII